MPDRLLQGGQVLLPALVSLHKQPTRDIRMSQDAGHPDDANAALARRTTPTWEMELLLSGAAVFAMVQLAQALPGWALYLLPRLDVQLQEITRLMLVYANAAVLVLAATFVLHLVLRAYWVGLTGMNSVYPDGMKWDAVRAGPIAKALMLRRWPNTADAIERADNRATVVFSVGIGMALIFVPIMLAVSILYLLASGIAWLFGMPDALIYLFFGLTAAWMTPYFAALALDKLVGRRLRPDGWLYRATARVIAIYSATGMARESNPLVALYSSNVGERRGTVTVVAVMLLAMSMTFVASTMMSDDLGPGSFAAFPDPRRGMDDSVDGRHYASRSDGKASPDVPYVPDLVSSGKYLRLVIPYLPGLYGHLLSDCPAGAVEATDSERERQRRAARLDCLAEGFEVRLNGQRLEERPEWYTEPRQDLRGLIYMVPVGTLPPGRHVLSVLPRPGPEAAEGEPPPPPYVIPFWR